MKEGILRRIFRAAGLCLCGKGKNDANGRGKNLCHLKTQINLRVTVTRIRFLPFA